MYDPLTWILIGLVAVVVIAIVVLASIRVSRRRRLARELGESETLGESEPDTSVIGDRSDILHRARRRF
ncbi:hypothetical protein QCD70_06235 [Agreia sp. PsM10]|uniref:hypothetical protein n=1 Tax=Agreia sp. PsM10 TaxID=3030533 RepID=UPI00263B1864|nr:hypothetical protein [Agreia sp. PsM10]MDN4639833.1 hypothetical protein [Agreia sp. PsM10]